MKVLAIWLIALTSGLLAGLSGKPWVLGLVVGAMMFFSFTLGG